MERSFGVVVGRLVRTHTKNNQERQFKFGCPHQGTHTKKYYERGFNLRRSHQATHTVFMIHIPIIVSLAVLMQGIHVYSLLKFGLAAVIGVPLCFGVAYLVRKIPLADNVL
jgi:hypothetical protein